MVGAQESLTRIAWKSRSGDDQFFFHEKSEDRFGHHAGWRFKVYRSEQRPVDDDWFVLDVTEKEPGIAATTNLYDAEKSWYTNKSIALVIEEWLPKILAPGELVRPHEGG